MQDLNEGFCLPLPSFSPTPRHLTSWNLTIQLIALNGRGQSSFSLRGHVFTKLVGASLAKRIKLLSQVCLKTASGLEISSGVVVAALCMHFLSVWLS